jgi:hypothetical protein
MESPEPSAWQASGGRKSPDDAADESGGEADTRLERAARQWMRRGYTVRYRDPYLIQLIRPWRPFWLLVPLIASGVLALTLIMALVRRLLSRRWHVVTLTEAPDGRVITHQMQAPRPPED